MSGIKEAAFETITPQMAKAYLWSNTERNRKIRDVAVNTYATDMAAGRWVANGEPIIFDDSGELIDGQHRLKAVVKANVPVEMLVVRGVPSESFTTIDQGVTRSLGTVLGIPGIDSSIVRALTTFDKTGSVEKAVRASTADKPTVQEMNEWYRLNAKMVKPYSAYYSRLRVVTGKLSLVAVVVSLHAMHRRRMDVQGFVDSLCTAFTPKATQLSCVFARSAGRIEPSGKTGRHRTAQLLCWLAECYQDGREPKADVSNRFNVTRFDSEPQLPLWM